MVEELAEEVDCKGKGGRLEIEPMRTNGILLLKLRVKKQKTVAEYFNLRTIFHQVFKMMFSDFKSDCYSAFVLCDGSCSRQLCSQIILNTKLHQTHFLSMVNSNFGLPALSILLPQLFLEIEYSLIKKSLRKKQPI